MLRPLLILVLLLAALFWFEPWLRQINAVEAALHPWLPVLTPETWSTVIIVTLAVAAAVGLLLLIKLGLFIWRQIED